jgi:hypothetical protein
MLVRLFGPEPIGWHGDASGPRVKAVVFKGKCQVAVKGVEDPRIEAPTDAIIKITSTTICGSDLHMYEGRTAASQGQWATKTCVSSRMWAPLYGSNDYGVRGSRRSSGTAQPEPEQPNTGQDKGGGGGQARAFYRGDLR